MPKVDLPNRMAEKKKKKWGALCRALGYWLVAVSPSAIMFFLWDELMQAEINPFEVMSKTAPIFGALGVIVYNLRTKAIDYVLRCQQNFTESLSLIRIARQVTRLCGKLMLGFFFLTVACVLFAHLDTAWPAARYFAVVLSFAISAFLLFAFPVIKLFEKMEEYALYDYGRQALNREEESSVDVGGAVDSRYTIT